MRQRLLLQQFLSFLFSKPRRTWIAIERAKMASTGIQLFPEKQPASMRDAGGDNVTRPLENSDDNSTGYPTEKDHGFVEELGGDAASLASSADEISHPADKDDILHHTIHLDDDPNEPALTFRTWFLGKAFGPTAMRRSSRLTLRYRCYPSRLRWNYICHLLLQTADNSGFHRVSRRRCVHLRRGDVSYYPEEGSHWTVPQSPSFQQKRAHCYHGHGKLCVDRGLRH